LKPRPRAGALFSNMVRLSLSHALQLAAYFCLSVRSGAARL
jgi:hypothetical protein